MTGADLLARALVEIEVMYPASLIRWAKIDPRNAASKNLFEAAGFERAGLTGDYEIWVRAASAQPTLFP